MKTAINRDKEHVELAEADKIREILAILPESDKAVLWGMINGFKIAYEATGKETA